MRVGILSFAHLHAEGYIENLRAIPDIEVIGIADDNAERGRFHAEQFGARLFPSYEALLAEKPDAVVVTSENTRHLPLVKMAAEAGAHVLCEKPLATTVEDCQAIIDACDQAGVKLMTAFPMRFSAPTIEVKQLVDSGRLGHILAASGANNGRCPVNLRPWFVDRKLSGGGAVMDHVVHLADVLRWFFKSEVVEVYAQMNKVLYPEVADVETAGLVLMTFDNGTFASIDCSWSRPLYYPTWGGLTLDLVGESGMTALDAFKQNITVHSHAAQRPQLAHWGSDSNQGMVNEFIAAIREQRAPSITGYDGLKATEIVQAAYRSAAEGAPVRIQQAS